MPIIKKIICFDIDNTICFTKGSEYSSSKPKKKIIKLIIKLYENNTIILFTSRYMNRYNGNLKLVYKKKKITEKQIRSWNLKYHKLIMGKPIYDFFIDDKAFNNKEKFFKDLIKNF